MRPQTGEFPCQQGSDDRLTVRPPEFHVVPVFLHRFAVETGKREQAAVRCVPAPRPHPVENPRAERDEPSVPAQPALVHNEPRALDGVPRIQRTPVKMIENGSGRRNNFQQRRVLRLEEIALNFCDEHINPLAARPAAGRHVTGIRPQFLRCHHADHQCPDSFHRARCFKLRFHHARFKTAAEVNLPGLQRVVRCPSVTGSLRKGRITDRRECLAEDVAPHPQRRSFARDGEPHLPVR